MSGGRASRRGGVSRQAASPSLGARRNRSSRVRSRQLRPAVETGWPRWSSRSGIAIVGAPSPAKISGQAPS